MNGVFRTQSFTKNNNDKEHKQISKFNFNHVLNCEELKVEVK